MSLEYVEEFANTKEQAHIFEELSYTRNFGEQTYNDVKHILKENSEYWRLPTLAELYALKKQNKSDFFKQKNYWAGETSSELREFRIGLLGTAWYYSSENEDKDRYLVLIKRGTQIDGTEDEDVKEELSKIAL